MPPSLSTRVEKNILNFVHSFTYLGTAINDKLTWHVNTFNLFK